MNDRFKFRVFGLCCNSKLEKNWVNITEVGNFLIDKDGKLIDESAYFDPINHPEHFIIEQYTGLKDKNGNLIYEGDIVKCDRDFDPDGRVNLTKEVIFTDGSFTLANLDPKNRDFCYINRFHNIEIIGNIHEQAEQKDK